MKLCPGTQVLLDVEGEFLIMIGGVFVVRVLGQIVFIRQERANTSQLQDAFATVHNSQFITAHELLAQLLIVCSVAWTIASRIRGIEGIDRFLAERFGEFFQSSGFGAAQEDLTVHVADDGIGIVLVNGLQLRPGLQHQTGTDLTGTDGGNQLLQVRDLADVCRLIDQAPHMDRESAAVNIIRFLAQLVEQLRVDHTDQEIEAAVCI